MDYRSGKCSQCGAEYKIPASFAHNQARCRKCNGVVHLEAVPGRAPDAPRRAAGKEEERTTARASEPEVAPRPAPAPAPKPAPASAPTPAPAPSPRPAAAAAARKPEAPAELPAPRGGAEPAAAKKRSKAGILVAVALVLAALVLFLLRDKLFGDDAAPAVGAVPERSGEAG